jgi:PAS domain S-box-containing protein
VADTETDDSLSEATTIGECGLSIRAFSVKQPWASLLAAGVKRFEVGTWAPRKPGLFIVHASSGKADGIRERRAEPLFRKALCRARLADEKAWPRSAFVGLVDITRMIAPEDDRPEDVTGMDEYLGGGDGVFLWEVGRRWVFPAPVPCHGKLNLWRPPEALVPGLCEQLRQAGAGVELGTGAGPGWVTDSGATAPPRCSRASRMGTMAGLLGHPALPVSRSARRPAACAKDGAELTPRPEGIMSDERSALARRLLDLALGEVGTHAVVLLDPGGVIVGWLAGAERLFGYTADEIVGRNASVLFTPEDLEKDLSSWELKTAAASGESEDDRWQVRKDGGRIWVGGTLTALRDERGELLGFAKIMRNRTDQKSQVETLEGRVAHLQRAEERKNAFIATLAHELRNPLSALSNATRLLEPCEAAEPGTALAVGTIRRQAEFMGRMVDDLLEVARTAAGKVELRKERVVLQEVVRRAVETCRPAIDERTHVVQPLLPDVPVHLDADPARLQQVFVNLLQNAVKYTEYGGTIWVKATTEGDEAVVRVQDTGVGIPPEVMPHIFDLFTQAEFAARSPGGLGIGLSVVRDYVALHGGTVQAASDGLGKGSEFTVRLPLPDHGQHGPQAPTDPEREGSP